ncbi:MAG TPA: GNAT family N-acetyltransferase [Candidatus Sulfotelmatobacter sp.]|nr:GNAT family N-acetyltransferase [Candidatus Sulfotelmatobacter sp.]
MSPRPPRPPALRYRTARRTDVETLADLGYRAYRVASLEKRREFYTDHPRFTIRDVRVGELEGQIVASMVLYPLTALVRGQKLPVVGVGSVAVSPEHRRRGVAETLMKFAIREMRQRGDALSMLYAFRGSYYRKLGYGVIEYVHQVAASPANLPVSDEARFVRRLMIPDRPAVQALFEKVSGQGHFALVRKPEWWTQRLWGYASDWVVYEGRRRGQIEGYLCYDVDHSNGPFKLQLSLLEFVAATPAAFKGLVGYLASLRDQVAEIHSALPADHAWLHTLQTAQNLRPGLEISVFADTAGVAAGAMLRFTDVKLGLEMLPVSPHARGEVVVELDDSVIAANARAWRVSAREGRLTVAPESPRAGRRRPPRLRMPMDALGPIAGGTLSPRRAAEAGLIEASGGADEIVDSWFRARPAFLYQLNGF